MEWSELKAKAKERFNGACRLCPVCNGVVCAGEVPGMGGVGTTVLVWKTFDLNKRYGQHGLMKIAARKNHPRYLINRKRVRSLFKERRLA